MDTRKCPKCRASDRTDFSKCRFCGSPYDGSPAGSRPTSLPSTGPNFNALFWPITVVVLGLLWMNQTTIINAVGFVATKGKSPHVVQDALVNYASAGDPQIKSGLQDALEYKAKRAAEGHNVTDEEMTHYLQQRGYQ